MKKRITFILIMIVCIIAIMLLVYFNTKGEYSQTELSNYNQVELENITSRFKGVSNHFGFNDGQVYYSNSEKAILIKGFYQNKEIENLELVEYTIYFNNKLWASQDTNRNLNNPNSTFIDVAFYERGEICPADYGYECEQSYFSMVDEENFLDSIKVEVKYYTKNASYKEYMTISYK